MSVDFPAPFSPSRACTSPRRRSKSTLSFATSAPKRFVTPFSSRAGEEADWLRALLHLSRDVRELPRRDLGLLGVDLVGVLGADVVGLAVAHAVGLHVEHRVLAAPERVVLDVGDRLEHRLVDLLERRGHHLRAEIRLVGVDADALDVLLLGRVERAEPALAGDLEDDLRALADLVQRE